jgi:hypothetical protein
MKIWYDTEFIEDGKTIDLISIGMVADDGREYYAISTEFDASKASTWVKENVLIHLPDRDSNEGLAHYRTRAKIKKELLWFIGDDKPELWAYYADYDHVALCQLFGTMMDLPKGWPMYTKDIKQFCDALGNPSLPEQRKGEHNALDDARWNKKAFDFLIAEQWQLNPNRKV